MQLTQMKNDLVEGCDRLASKGFLHTSYDSFSLRVPGKTAMVLVSGQKDWRNLSVVDVRVVPFSVKDDSSGLHAFIYEQRGDVGCVAISSPRGVELLASLGVPLPPIFDEQVRHIGTSEGSLANAEAVRCGNLWKAFEKGANAALLGEQLVCLGMTRERALFNTELYEKCARAYVLAKACDKRINHIPFWVRMIAYRRLLKDEAVACTSYREGRIPEAIQAY
ncbi:class II aldolase/adducin family protein [Granulicella sp. L46]|uniref:class II aldolase/adducin family protein n=1 Tax=Granulicella sp. L46 TaxID=1641865 RepID=UPI00131D0E44|nr:class II aldolase/adducin family protein [Granulicella sp. L46]